MQQPDITKLRLKGFSNEVLIPTGILKRVRDVVEHEMQAAEFDGHEHSGRCAGNKECTRYSLRIDCPVVCDKEDCGNSFYRDGFKAIKVREEKDQQQVRTRKRIKMNACVGDYAGFVLGVTDYRSLMKDIQEAESAIGAVDYINGRMFALVARDGGNWSRLLKHSCEPNLRAVSMTGVDKVPRVRLYALRDIQPGEVLTVNFLSQLCNKGFKYRCECEKCNAVEPVVDVEKGIEGTPKAVPTANQDKPEESEVCAGRVADPEEKNQDVVDGELGGDQDEVTPGVVDEEPDGKPQVGELEAADGEPEVGQEKLKQAGLTANTGEGVNEPQAGPSSRCGVIFFADRAGNVTRKEGNVAGSESKRYELRLQKRKKDEQVVNRNVSKSRARTVLKHAARRKVKSAVKAVNGKKLFGCSSCDRAFNWPYLLRRHMSVHSEERRFCCEKCGMGFKRLSNMKRHKDQFHTEN